jgi:hypothetical protein
MITWKKSISGKKIRGVIQDMIVYRQISPNSMVVFSETDLHNPNIKFKFTIKR